MSGVEVLVDSVSLRSMPGRRLRAVYLTRHMLSGVERGGSSGSGLHLEVEPDLISFSSISRSTSKKAFSMSASLLRVEPRCTNTRVSLPGLPCLLLVLQAAGPQVTEHASCGLLIAVEL